MVPQPSKSLQVFLLNKIPFSSYRERLVYKLHQRGIKRHERDLAAPVGRGRHMKETRLNSVLS